MRSMGSREGLCKEKWLGFFKDARIVDVHFMDDERGIDMDRLILERDGRRYTIRIVLVDYGYLVPALEVVDQKTGLVVGFQECDTQKGSE